MISLSLSFLPCKYMYWAPFSYVCSSLEMVFFPGEEGYVHWITRGGVAICQSTQTVRSGACGPRLTTGGGIFVLLTNPGLHYFPKTKDLEMGAA